MKREWFCLDCNFWTELDTHGRCSRCQGNGIAPPTVRTKSVEDYEVELLERLYERSEG